MEFSARVENFNTRLWSYHFKVPSAIAHHFLEMGDKRVICSLNDTIHFQCAIMPAGDDVFFILLNKKIRDTLALKENSRLEVKIEKDTSTYGLPFPDEFKEVLAQDKAGKKLFDQLTPGKQRNLLYVIGQVKNTDGRIHRSFIVVEHLKMNNGKIDFRKLNQELRQKPD